jgi:translation initiation factor 2 alpha subunit (eIF-2alpha)
VRRDLKDAQVVQRTLLIRIQEDKEELERKIREMNALNQHFGQHVEVLEQAANTQQELIQGLTLLIEQASEIKAQVETLPISDMVAPFR